MSSGSTSWSSQANTKAGSSVTSDVFTDATVSGDLLVSGNKITFGNGATIHQENSNYVEITQNLALRANTGENNLTMFMGASNFVDPCGWSHVIAHTTGKYVMNNNLGGGSYLEKLSLTTAGLLSTVGGLTASGGDITITAATGGLIHTNSGTTTQETSITTAVTCHATSGIITMYATGIAADENIEFTVNNSTVQADSVILLTMQDENTVDNTQLVCATHTIADNSFKITVANTDSAQASSDTANKIHFLVINNS
jgi:hypothetical protein